jgi:hypothetical protein
MTPREPSSSIEPQPTAEVPEPAPASAAPASYQGRDRSPEQERDSGSAQRTDAPQDFDAAETSYPVQDVSPAARTADNESTPPEPDEHEIRWRAYLRFLARGAVHGADFDDWIQAEMELRRR